MIELIPEKVFEEIIAGAKNSTLRDLINAKPSPRKVILTSRQVGKSFFKEVFEGIAKRVKEEERKAKEWQEKYGKEQIIFT